MGTNRHEWGGTREWEGMRGRCCGGVFAGGISGLNEPGYNGWWRGWLEWGFGGLGLVLGVIFRGS